MSQNKGKGNKGTECMSTCHRVSMFWFSWVKMLILLYRSLWQQTLIENSSFNNTLTRNLDTVDQRFVVSLLI